MQTGGSQATYSSRELAACYANTGLAVLAFAGYFHPFVLSSWTKWAVLYGMLYLLVGWLFAALQIIAGVLGISRKESGPYKHHLFGGLLVLMIYVATVTLMANDYFHTA